MAPAPQTSGSNPGQAPAVPGPVPGGTASADSGVVTVRLWASARAAAGTPELGVVVPGPVTVDRLREEVARALPERAQLPRVLAVCSVLLGDRPVHDPEQLVAPGATVEFLPPFAGG